MFNKHLERQLKKQNIATDKLSAEMIALLQNISESYNANDKDRTMLERTIELNSEELIKLNTQIRNESDDKLKKAQRKFKSLFDNARDPIFLLDENQRFIDCNNATVKILGAKCKEQLLNKLPEDFSPEYQPDGKLSADKAIDMGKLAFENGNTQFDWIHQRLDKSVFPVDVSITIIPIEDKNVYLVNWRDITERKLAEEKLKNQYDELQKTNQELDKFVYSVSHDLRAPLTSMLGVIKISEKKTTDELILKHFGMLKKSITKLDGFILDILEYSRNARLDIKKEPIDFNEMLSDVTENLKFMAIDHNVDLKINIEDHENFNSDRSRILVIMNNLISNAFRYKNPDNTEPRVEVNIKADNRFANIIIQDNGIGICKEHHEKIFDMFYRVSENSVGSGLGLYIVKETIEKLKGNIKIESEPGIGSQFVITIPSAA
jgi:PAS domain S-box-containing protein